MNVTFLYAINLIDIVRQWVMNHLFSQLPASKTVISHAILIPPRIQGDLFFNQRNHSIWKYNIKVTEMNNFFHLL